MPVDRLELLSTAEMRRADEAAIASGTAGIALMESAGAAVAAAVEPFPGAVLVLAGPGNNGGDGYVAARLLALAGREVTVAALHGPGARRGDAAWAASRWTGPTIPIAAAEPGSAGVVVDALFGAGLARPIDGIAAAALAKVAQNGRPVVAVDVPSGVHGDTGEILGPAVQAASTVTFARLKRGHLLYPGRGLCGRLVLADIGIADDVVESLGVRTWLNRPALWRDRLARPSTLGHKYDRGHVLVLSGGLEGGGAARLASRAALRAGAGLVTLAAPSDALAVHAAALDAVMVRRSDGFDGLDHVLEDPRRNCVVLGPALGVGFDTREKVARVLSAGRKVVLDADALTSFSSRAGALSTLIRACSQPVVLTPHEGEFVRLFGEIPGSKLDRARAAADLAGAVIVLKGGDTVVAEPGGRAAIADNAPPDLATAGAGDVLAGIVGGLLAQGMDGFEAAAAAVWMHGEAARLFGAGLISEDLPGMLPQVLAGLRAEAGTEARVR